MISILVTLVLALVVMLYIAIMVCKHYSVELKIERGKKKSLENIIKDVVAADINYRSYAGNDLNKVEDYLLKRLLKETSDASHKYLKMNI